MKGTRVTCEDVESGETETKVIVDDWLLITDGKVELTSVQTYGNGTAQLTIKKRPA